MNDNFNADLRFTTILPMSDMMGFIPQEDKDMVDSIQVKEILNDEDILHFRSIFPDRNIDNVIRCHLVNNCKLYRNGHVVPTDFLEWFGELDNPISAWKIVKSLSKT